MEFLVSAALVVVGYVFGVLVAVGRGTTPVVLSPTFLAGGLLVVRTVPALVMMSFDPAAALDPLLMSHPATAGSLTEASLVVGIGHAIALVALGAGERWAGLRGIQVRVPAGGGSWLMRYPGTSASAFLCLGVALLAVYLVRVGGLQVILNFLGSRSVLSAGRGYLTASYSVLLILSVCSGLIWFARGPTVRRRALLTSLVAVALVGMNATGGRSDTLLLVLCAALTWHLKVRHIRLKSSYLAAGVILLLAYVAVVPTIRQSAGKQLSAGGKSLQSSVAEGLATLAEGNGYAGSQMLVVSHFNSVDRLWLGRSWLDIVIAPVPRSLFRDKPPVDDGVYLFSIARGMRAEPSMPYSQLTLSAWPLQTFGAAYANFHLVGVVACFFLLGAVLMAVYRGALADTAGLTTTVFYGMCLWRLQLSNLGIVTTVTFFVLLAAAGVMVSALVKQIWGLRPVEVAGAGIAASRQ